MTYKEMCSSEKEGSTITSWELEHELKLSNQNLEYFFTF